MILRQAQDKLGAILEIKEMGFGVSVPITNLLIRRNPPWREITTIGVCPNSEALARNSSFLIRNSLGLESTTAAVSTPAHVGLFDVSGRNKISARKQCGHFSARVAFW